MQRWLVLAYNVPREPTANRVSIWRKLKRLGAVLLNDAAWALPATPQTAEHFQWLATEIKELGGTCTVWRAELMEGDEQALVKQFAEQLDEPYREILAALKRKAADLPALSRRYQLLQAQDYFRSGLGKRVREALIAKGASTK